MISCLVIGDPHFKVNNSRDTDLFAKSVVEIIKDRKPDFVVVLGDTLDRHELIHQSPLKRATLFLKDICSLCPTYLLIGNHDRPNNSAYLTDDHPFHALTGWDNMKVIDKPYMTKIKQQIFSFVPYVPPGRFHEALESLDEKEWQKSAAIFAHQEFKDAKMGTFVSTKGDPWPSSYPLVISGHIHEYSKTNNIIYVGTPFQHAYDESPNKAVSLFKFDNKKYNEERVKVGVPAKQTVEIKCTEIDTFDIKKYGDSEVKLIIRGSLEEIKTMKKLAMIRSLIKRGVKVVYKEDMIVDNTDTFIAKKKMSFVEIMEHSLKEEKEALTLFRSIFGTRRKKIMVINTE